MRKPIQRVNIDFTASLLEELERAAKELNVTRQAIIKSLIRQGLDQHHIARTSRSPTNRS
jgi:metal-responsive CopG/Arc/MetJ family transcriptional regulator